MLFVPQGTPQPTAPHALQASITPHNAKVALCRDASQEQSLSESRRQHGDSCSITAGLAKEAIVKGIEILMAKLFYPAVSLHTFCFCAGVTRIPAAHGGPLCGIILQNTPHDLLLMPVYTTHQLYVLLGPLDNTANAPPRHPGGVLSNIPNATYAQASEEFLQCMVALCVASHYRNTPNDLLLMADAPAHQLFVLLGPLDGTVNVLPDILVVFC